MQSDHRARIEAILLGEYGVQYPIASGRFHMMPPDQRSLDQMDLGTLERAVLVDMPNARTPVIPTDRAAGYGVFSYPVNVQVGYVVTGAGEAWEALGEQSGAATWTAVQDRANEDRQAIESALGSWLNTGGLTPHVIDLNPTGGGGIEQRADRAILTVPFSMMVRVPL